MSECLLNETFGNERDTKRRDLVPLAGAVHLAMPTRPLTSILGRATLF